MSNPFLSKFRTAFLLCLFSVAMIWPNQHADAQNLITTMTEQIAKLELYLQNTRKGYSIVQQGLTTIGKIKKGDFDLHSLFFTTLKDVNPAIKNWGKVTDIIAMQVQIFFGCATTLKQFTSSGDFSSNDLKYLNAVYSNLKDLTIKDIDELMGIITDGTWQMSDDERMSRIDLLFDQVSEKYTFLRAFSNRVSLEGQIRAQEKNSLQNLGKLFQP